jgi:MATE family multidrug resistance protein
LTLVTTLLLTGIGLMMGTLVLTAATHGAGHDAACGIVWRRSLLYASGLGLMMALVGLAAEPIFRAFGQTPAMAAAAAPVAAVLGLGLLPQLLFVTSQFFLEGLRRPLPGMLLMLAANLLNVVLNAMLVYGMAGMPALGALGSAWATTFVRSFLALGVLAYILLVMPDRQRFLTRIPGKPMAPPARLQRRLGYASGLSIGVEGAAFNTLGLFAGWQGPLVLAAYTIGLNLIAFVFMIAVGLGAATAVQVGAACGRGALADARLAGWTGVCLTTLVLGLIAAGIASAPASLLALYTADPALQRVALPAIAFVAFVVVADGWQGVLAGAVRGLGDTWVASALHAASFVLVMLPAGWLLAIHGERGPLGLFEAMALGCTAAALVLAGRFAYLTRRAGSSRLLPSQAGDG